MKNVKKIAVAVDFSENSKAAYNYSKLLAKAINVDLELIHVHSLPVNPDSIHGMAFIPSVDEQLKSAMTMLKNFADDKTIKCTVHTGFALDKLVELSQEKAFDLLVIGNSGERGLLSQVFGSVALGVAKKAHCPVLLVPQDAAFEGITDIVYATSEKSTDEDGIAVTKDWAKSFRSKIHFVHVDRPETNDFLPDITTYMKGSDIEYSIKDLDYVTVRGGIDIYCEKEPIDLIVSMSQNYSFWDSIFHRSITSALAWNNRLPLLVLHKDIVEAGVA